jgi:hypothetical protein
MRHEKFEKANRLEAHDLAKLEIAAAQPQVPFRSAEAAPDVPAAVGRMLAGAFVALLATFAATMAHSREALFAIAICAIFLTMYFTVPRIFLGVEPKQGERPSFDMFLDNGLDTYTGHVSGKEALVQILIVPVLLTFCALTMGIVALEVL